jgi:hypothetical protein
MILCTFWNVDDPLWRKSSYNSLHRNNRIGLCQFHLYTKIIYPAMCILSLVNILWHEEQKVSTGPRCPVTTKCLMRSIVVCMLQIKTRCHCFSVARQCSLRVVAVSLYITFNYNSLLARLTPSIGSKTTNRHQMNQTHTQTTIIIHK